MGAWILIAAAIQVGVIGAVSALVAPLVFRVLAGGPAGAFLRGLFPRYFVTAAVLALVAGALALVDARAGVAALLLADAVCFIAARALVPAINAAKDRGDPAFGRLHGASVILNMAGLGLAVAAIGVLALS